MLSGCWVIVLAGRTVDAQVEDIHMQMARRHLFVRAERMYKKPKPGRKRLVKWPKKLVYDQVWPSDGDRQPAR